MEGGTTQHSHFKRAAALSSASLLLPSPSLVILKVSLADVGVVGGLSDGSDEKQKAPQATYYMGRAMGSGSGGLRTGMSSSSPTAADDIFSNFSSQQYQFGGFQK